MEESLSRTPRERRQEIILKIAVAAQSRELLPGGLWFHDDVRNNFYYASYLLAAAADASLDVPFGREDAKRKAEAVLLETVLLQNRVPGTSLYGHWPLNLSPVPRAASPHALPAELMGSLMVWFCAKYGSHLGAGLRVAFHTAIGHVYRSGFFRRPVEAFNHHEAKSTAAKLIFGKRFNDEELREDGKRSLITTLKHLRSQGMPEYGALPWFWHWVQAFTCAWELEEETEISQLLAVILDELWQVRAEWYLRGAWVGAHSRGWPHDMPADGNVLHDYIQFGDFELPAALPRTEYAGLLFYEAPEAARRTALNRRAPVEIKKLVHKVPAGSSAPEQPLHSYAYITKDFAAGGMWERQEEFDNEQLRWSLSFPVRGDGLGNQLYFFHPGAGYREGDPRHQSESMEVLYHQNTVLGLFPVPRDNKTAASGVLPHGEWLQKPGAMFGRIGSVYVAVFLPESYELREYAAYLGVILPAGAGGVAVEALSSALAAKRGIHSLDQFAEVMSQRAPVFAADDEPEAEYRNWWNERLTLRIAGTGETEAYVNGSLISFDDYTV
ncbi:hypothetical protein [Paenibacillus tengchongensis]|uniref:hypothetical protein n=1 Tax=Paenibacillus tengchongensis TaxID=2608684 RepID=UPI00124C17C5|nr:hypothetical protein [Paenibacillus tengchongensis]